MNLRGRHYPDVTKENVKNVGKERTWTDQKRVCARPKRGGVGGCSTTSSEGRERRRRRAEDVGVVLWEAARVFARFRVGAIGVHCLTSPGRGRLLFDGDNWVN